MQRRSQIHSRRRILLGTVVMVVVCTLSTLPAQVADAVVGDRATFANDSPIQFGPARGSQYVSTIAVSGQPTKLEDVNVSLLGFRSAWNTDVDVVLESPRGTRVTVMSDPIGIGNTCYLDSRVFDLTFDDAASDFMVGGWRSGTFKPRDYSGCDDGDTFVPATNYDTLSQFNGEDPNGMWKLYLADDANSGQVVEPNELRGGWALDLGYPAPPIASGDLQIAGPENSAFHNFRTCAVTSDGGTVTYPIKIINTGDEAAQFRLRTQAPAFLYASPFTTTKLPQNELGYLTALLAPGASKTYVAKIKLPAAPGHTESTRALVALSDTNGTRLDWGEVCATESAGAATTTSELLVKPGNQLQVPGIPVLAVTGKTLVPGGATATFVATLKNRQAATRRMTFQLLGGGWAESPDCDNIAVTIKTGGVDITSSALDRVYMTAPTVRGQSRTFTITVRATGPKSAVPHTCDWDYWYLEAENSEMFLEVNLAAPAI